MWVQEGCALGRSRNERLFDSHAKAKLSCYNDFYQRQQKRQETRAAATDPRYLELFDRAELSALAWQDNRKTRAPRAAVRMSRLHHDYCSRWWHLSVSRAFKTQLCFHLSIATQASKSQALICQFTAAGPTRAKIRSMTLG